MFSILCYIIFFKINTIPCEEIAEIESNYLTRAEYQKFFLAMSPEERIVLVKIAKKTIEEAYIQGVVDTKTLNFTLNLLDIAFNSDETIKKMCSSEDESIFSWLNILYHMVDNMRKQQLPSLENMVQMHVASYDPKELEKICFVALLSIGLIVAGYLTLEYFKLI